MGHLFPGPGTVLWSTSTLHWHGHRRGSRVRRHISQYDHIENNGGAMPRYVRLPLEDGYQISHRGLLVWTPVPSAADVPRFRLLFLAMEATPTFLFWAMQSKIKDYDMANCCPWPRDSFSYGGLCSHNALWEGIAGDIDLTVEQLEDIVARAKELQRSWKKNYRKQYKAIHGDRVRELSRKSSARRRKENLEQQGVKDLLRNKTMKESHKYFCAPCGVACQSGWELWRHNGSQRHLDILARPPDTSEVPKTKVKIAAEKSVAEKRFYYAICKVACISGWTLERHNGSRRHVKKVAMAESSSRSTEKAYQGP